MGARLMPGIGPIRRGPFNSDLGKVKMISGNLVSRPVIKIPGYYPLSHKIKTLLEMPSEKIAWEYYGDHYSKHPDVTRELSYFGFENPFEMLNEGISKAFKLRESWPEEGRKYFLTGMCIYLMTELKNAISGHPLLRAKYDYEVFKFNCIFAGSMRRLGFKSGIVFSSLPYQRESLRLPEADMTPLSWVVADNNVLRVDLRKGSYLFLAKAIIFALFDKKLPLMLGSINDLSFNSSRQTFARYAYLKGCMFSEAGDEIKAEDEFTKAVEIDHECQEYILKLEWIANKLLISNNFDRISVYRDYIDNKLSLDEMDTFVGLYRAHRSIRYFLEAELSKINKEKRP